jgi:hypothetical protein
MKFLKILMISSICMFLQLEIIAQKVYVQGGRNHSRHARKTVVVKKNVYRPNRVVVVKRSVYRPHRVIVYRPYWRPYYACKRRWVYFPRYNVYWDNWRNHYVFWNGTIWSSQPTRPALIVNVNLEKEKSTELKETEDDIDDVYASNDTHKTEYKAE